jgi:GT2 family glycosyltransferase
MDLSIIIINWNVKHWLEKCLASIVKETKDLDYEVIVVDNNSTDGSQKLLDEIKHQTSSPKAGPLLESEPIRSEPHGRRPLAEKIKIVFNDRNIGFAKANNQALQIAKGEFILFLNPDTEVLEETIIRAVQFMRENLDCGVMGCQIISLDNKIQPSVRSSPSLLSQILILSKLQYLFFWLKTLRQYYLYNFDYQKLQEVNQVMGAFFLTRKEVIEKVGPFDEKFFLWFEEVDFCRRVKQAGWRIIYNSEIKIRHYGRQSFSQLLPYQKQKIYGQSLLYYFQKYHSRWQVWVLNLAQIVGLCLTLLIQPIYRLVIMPKAIKNKVYQRFYGSSDITHRN